MITILFVVEAVLVILGVKLKFCILMLIIIGISVATIDAYIDRVHDVK